MEEKRWMDKEYPKVKDVHHRDGRCPGILFKGAG